MGRFLVWCTGARPDHVQPGMERNRYVTMGLSILVTALLASGSMMVLTGFLVEDISPAVQVPLALFWALVVFTVDRTVAVTLVDGQRAWQQFLMYLPRLLLAAGSAYLISEPLVLQVFDQEIQEQRVIDSQRLREQFRIEIDARPDFVTRIQEANGPVAAVQADVEALKGQAEDLGAAARREEEGLGATGEPSCGRVCLDYRRQQEAKLAEVRLAEGRLPAAQQEVAAELARVEDDKVKAVDERVAQYIAADGFAARHEALQAYLAGSPTGQLLRWSLTGVLVLVDLLVLTFKVLGAQTLHDMRMKTERAAVRDRLERDLEVAKERNLGDAREAADRAAEFAEEQAERERDIQRAQGHRRNGAFSFRAWLAQSLRDLLGDDLAQQVEVEPDSRDNAPRRGSERAKHRPGINDTVGGRYRLVEEIGRGGYGVVFRAEVRGEPDVAVKIQPGGRAGAFWRDVQNIPRTGKYVAEVLEPGAHGSWRYIVYPLYRPGSLDRVCETTRATRSAQWCLEVIEQTLYALASGHASVEHIVHRDIKPGNILLDGDMVRVSDWGRATSSADGDSTALGTWKWAAPEVFDNRGRVDTSDGLTDLYSVGAVAYWLLSGQPPLAREIAEMHADFDDDGRTFAESRRLRPKRLDAIDPRIPSEIARLVDSWLAERRGERAGGQPEDRACLYALRLLRAAMDDHQDTLRTLMLTPGPDPTRVGHRRPGEAAVDRRNGAAQSDLTPPEPRTADAAGARNGRDSRTAVEAPGTRSRGYRSPGSRTAAPPVDRVGDADFDPTPFEPEADEWPRPNRRNGYGPGLDHKEVIASPSRDQELDEDDGDATPSNR
jgi:serine/threonine protein kinase